MYVPTHLSSRESSQTDMSPYSSIGIYSTTLSSSILWLWKGPFAEGCANCVYLTKPLGTCKRLSFPRKHASSALPAAADGQRFVFHGMWASFSDWCAPAGKLNRVRKYHSLLWGKTPVSGWNCSSTRQLPPRPGSAFLNDGVVLENNLPGFSFDASAAISLVAAELLSLSLLKTTAKKGILV